MFIRSKSENKEKDGGYCKQFMSADSQKMVKYEDLKPCLGLGGWMGGFSVISSPVMVGRSGIYFARDLAEVQEVTGSQRDGAEDADS